MPHQWLQCRESDPECASHAPALTSLSGAGRFAMSGVCLACVWRVCGVRPCHPALCAALRCAMQGGGGVTDEHAPGSADATEAMGALLGVVSAVRTLAHTVILSPRAPWRSITKPNQVKPTQINKGHPVGASPSLVGRHSRSACMATVCG